MRAVLVHRHAQHAGLRGRRAHHRPRARLRRRVHRDGRLRVRVHGGRRVRHHQRHGRVHHGVLPAHGPAQHLHGGEAPPRAAAGEAAALLPLPAQRRRGELGLRERPRGHERGAQGRGGGVCQPQVRAGHPVHPHGRGGLWLRQAPRREAGHGGVQPVRARRARRREGHGAVRHREGRGVLQGVHAYRGQRAGAGYGVQQLHPQLHRRDHNDDADAHARPRHLLRAPRRLPWEPDGDPPRDQEDERARDGDHVQQGRPHDEEPREQRAQHAVRHLPQAPPPPPAAAPPPLQPDAEGEPGGV
mmetsp:Transcript_16451/g.56015  ORF Transcript_16451/g.56015 Transcript_16451/m.56015 type:complete len:301 (+) Transcript_16451:939-1841(+)